MKSKIGIIIEREYITRVRKKSFFVISLLAPVFLIALVVVPAWLTSLDGEEKVMQVVDEANLLEGIDKIDNLNLVYSKELGLDSAKETVKSNKKKYDALLYIPTGLSSQNPDGVLLFADKNISLSLETRIERYIAKKLEAKKLVSLGIDPKTIKEAKPKVDVVVSPLTNKETRTNAVVASITAYLSAFLIYFFIFLFGAQVMRSVMEEKTNRIVEVMISSVKPFELMIGKIIGVALVAFTQFVIWIIIGGALFFAVSFFFSLGMSEAEAQAMIAQSGGAATQLETNLAVQQQLGALETLNFPLIIISFGFFFIMGYLIYGSLYAAVGSLVDNQTDSQQFMLPITIPLITSITLIGLVINDPDSTISFWASMFPLTSPIIMMVRIPFDPDTWEILLSMGILIITFLGITWVVSKIYRVGILMYGKKPTYKEISKWLFYKN